MWSNTTFPGIYVFNDESSSVRYRRCLKKNKISSGDEYGLATTWHQITENILHTRQSLLSNLSGTETVKEFFLNKRDSPLLSKATKSPLQTKVLSQFCSPDFDDIQMPCLADYKLSLENMFIGNASKPQLRCYPLSWEARISCAGFRGGATGEGVTSDSNPRLKLCALSKLWEQEGLKSMLDAKLTSWNGRHKRGTDGVIRIINPETAAPPLVWSDAGRSNRLSMQQQGKWKYYIYLDGNVGASRLGELALMNFLVLMPPSTKPQVDHYTLLCEWIHFIPIRLDFEDLYEKLLWCQKNDEKAKQIADNFTGLLLPRLTKDNIEDRMQSIISSLPNTTKDIEADFLIMWETYRASIYCLSVNNEIVIFRPFANLNYTNNWGGILKIRLEPPSLERFLEVAEQRFGKNEIIKCVDNWWDNGGLICNVMPCRGWGSGMLPELALLIAMAVHKLYIEER